MDPFQRTMMLSGGDSFKQTYCPFTENDPGNDVDPLFAANQAVLDNLALIDCAEDGVEDDNHEEKYSWRLSKTALEGMGLRHGEDAMVADAPDSFARAMVSVYNDDELWQLLSSNGQASLQGRFTPDVAKAALELAIRDVKGKASF